MHSFEARLPLVIVSGIAVVMACYIAANIAYFAVLSDDIIIDSDAIAIDFGKQVSNSVFGGALAILVAFSTMGSANGSIMSGGRAFFSVARAGQMPAAAAKLNAKGAPYIALIMQAVWSIVLILLPGSSFATLLDYAGPAAWLYYALTGSTVVSLRYSQPNLPRPFRVPWFPLPPILLILMAIALLINSLLRSPLYCFLAMFFVAISIPVWMVAERYLDDEQLNGLRRSLTGSADEDERGFQGGGDASKTLTEDTVVQVEDVSLLGPNSVKSHS
mmetsp:Transcript_23926/g.40700  ORF Transcript_23926/g.40700 Transcript_23926/m.40700 type:complete len:274 (-) Transcript_23926:215-1036(-)